MMGEDERKYRTIYDATYRIVTLPTSRSRRCRARVAYVRHVRIRVERFTEKTG
jgi:hypothetical protein